LILVDTNVAYALIDAAEPDHERCVQWFRRTGRTPLVVSPLVIAETCYLLDKKLGPEAEASFLGSVGNGREFTYQLVELLSADLARMGALVRRYADRHLGGTDASLVAIAERLKITMIATVNRRDFDNVRPEHIPAFEVVP
jgi:predicted nucleic acid-binding protein